MERSQAATPDEYLAELPVEQREAIIAVREVVRRSIPPGYVEGMSWGMLCWNIPLDVYPNTYNGQPLGYIALGAQKNYCAIYLMSVYGNKDREAELRATFAKAGKKLDMGKSCVRFRKAGDLALDAIADAVASMPPAAYIAQYEAARANVKTKPKARSRK